MGKLRVIESGEVHVLGKRCRIGRDATCDVPVEDDRVSHQHASLHWTSRGWELRDNGSRNGTYVRGRRLLPRERVALGESETFAVGVGARGFTLIDAGPPVARARCTTSGVVRTAADGVLVLPDDDRAAVSVLEASPGRWLAAVEDASRPVIDREIVMVDGEGWILDLPVLPPATQSVVDPPLLADVTLRFRVARNEEDIDIDVLQGDSVTVLRSRVCHYLLLTLARVRLEDAGASPAERGWVDRDVLCRMLGTDPPRLAVNVYRARNRFVEIGIIDGADVIARRAGTGQLRLGTDRIEVMPL